MLRSAKKKKFSNVGNFRDYRLSPGWVLRVLNLDTIGVIAYLGKVLLT